MTAVRVRKIPDACQSTELDDELIIVSSSTGLFFSATGIGREIWSRLDEVDQCDELCSSLVLKYDVSRQDCERQVTAFIEQLVQAGFVEYAPDG